MKKQKLLIIFSDIDETLVPIGDEDLFDFAELVKDIQTKENVIVKLSLISSRKPKDVLEVMDNVNNVFAKKGIKDFVEFGAGEQGGVLINFKEPKNMKFTGTVEDEKQRAYISILVKASRLGKYFDEIPNHKYLNTFVIKNKFQTKLSEKEKNEISRLLRVFLEKNLKDKIYMSDVVECLEIAPSGIGKDKALQSIMDEYAKKFEIVGITYSGDSENDRKPVDYVSRLSEIPGVRANVLLPANAYEILESSHMEKWKNIKKNVVSTNRIQKSEYSYFEGVLDLLKQKRSNGELISKGIQISKSKDDFELPIKKHEFFGDSIKSHHIIENLTHHEKEPKELNLNNLQYNKQSNIPRFKEDVVLEAGD